jgi:hypothetical protein
MNLTTEQLESLRPGDVIETGGIFPGLSKEQCVWEYLGTLLGMSQFRVRYMGISIGHVNATVKGDQVEFKMVKADER